MIDSLRHRFLCSLPAALVLSTVELYPLGKEQDHTWTSASSFCSEKGQRLPSHDSFSPDEFSDTDETFWWLDGRCTRKDVNGGGKESPPVSHYTI